MMNLPAEPESENMPFSYHWCQKGDCTHRPEQVGRFAAWQIDPQTYNVELQVRQQDTEIRAVVANALCTQREITIACSFEANTFTSYKYKFRLVCLKMLDDGDVRRLVLSPISKGRWRRVAVMQLQLDSGQHR